MNNTTPLTNEKIKAIIKVELPHFGPRTLNGIENWFARETHAQVRTVIAEMQATGELTCHGTGNLWRIGRKTRSK